MNRIAAALVTLLLTAFSGAMPAGADDEQPTEAQIGLQVRAELEKKGELILSSPLYGTLNPIARRISAIADPQYTYPFHFYLVHEKEPNAFAVPGGNVYVTDSLMSFVQNQEELAGVLCHETSHDIHHDVVHQNIKDERTGEVIGFFGWLTGLSKSDIGRRGEKLVYLLESKHYSRIVESAADKKGAITCAQAGFDPWGMVWLFQNFEKADTGGSLEVLSDHPNDAHRIRNLEREFKSDPSLFGSFSPDISTGTPLSLPPPQ
jgi:predicted Zn-dependent protease